MPPDAAPPADAGPRVRPRVLIIVGSGRSGSTLIERALGEVPGVAPLGETVHMWERGVRDSELCGCGQPFGTCPFWQSVGQVAFGGWHQIDAQVAIDDRQAVVRTRFIPELLGPSVRSGWRLRRDRLTRRLQATYEAAQTVSGATLLVDSSKMPAYAALLTRVVDLRCLYVVRDPRGVAWSWSKEVTRPEVVDASSQMHRYTPRQSAWWWSTFDAAVRSMARIGIPTHTVRYEDFVSDPRESIRDVLAFAGHPTDDARLAHLESAQVTLGPAHLVAGNPMRFRTGPMPLRVDDEWRRALPTMDRLVVTLLTAPSRRRYHYR